MFFIVAIDSAKQLLPPRIFFSQTFDLRNYVVVRKGSDNDVFTGNRIRFDQSD
jgi:hypothetical protein